MQYFVAGNLNHNGHEYKRGDTINLDEETGKGLIEVGVLKTEPIAGTEAARVPVQAPEPAQAEATGTPMQTGEPSVDGNGTTDRQNDNAVDVTPPVADEPAQAEATGDQLSSDANTAPTQASETPVEPNEEMARPTLEELAVSEGISEEDAKAAKNRAALVELILNHRKGETAPVEPEVDPSQGL